jgi:NADPH:quinone reductase-like Zn-dependent oxidoreductase
MRRAGTLNDGTEGILYPMIGNHNWRDEETIDVSRSFFSEGTRQGTLADYLVVPARNAIPKPKEMSIEAAAVMSTTWLTAYHALFTRSGLRAGQTMLVQGASGGVTTALIQLGHAAKIQV